MAGVFSAVFCSYSYSDIISGTTPNAAAGGVIWDMDNVLPPQAGLVVNGLIYRYTTDKNPEDDMTVTIQNEHLYENYYVIQETDDWSQLPPGTIVRRIDLANIPREIIGQGSIVVEGEGEVLDPSVSYSFRYDECYIVLSSPDCPGYNEALYAWLKENGFLDKEPDPNDPFYDEWVQLMLNRETDADEDEESKKSDEDEEEEDEGIEMMNRDVDIKGFVDGARQNAMLQSFVLPNFDSYTKIQLDGGVYEDTVVLQDGKIEDNRRALSNLAQDEVHRQMVRSQYENNN